MRTCSKCGETKPDEEFYVRDKSTGRRRRDCRDCVRRRSKQWYDAHDVYARERDRLKGHHITAEFWQSVLDAQGGRCAICGSTGEPHVLYIDHDHGCCPSPRSSCGRCVRGALCARCSTLTGLAKDSADYLRRAADYVEFGRDRLAAARRV